MSGRIFHFCQEKGALWHSFCYWHYCVVFACFVVAFEMTQAGLFARMMHARWLAHRGQGLIGFDDEVMVFLAGASAIRRIYGGGSWFGVNCIGVVERSFFISDSAAMRSMSASGQRRNGCYSM